MKVTCDRYGCTVGNLHVTYDRLLRRYVCAECGGRLVHYIEGQQAIHRVACADCGSDEVETEYRYLEEIAEGDAVIAGLPEALRKQMEGERPCQSVTEATADLLDLA